MNTRKNRCFGSITAFVLFFISVTISFAQPPGNRQMNVEQRIEMLKKNLKISDEQAAKIKPVLEAQDKEMAKIREDNKSNREAGIKAAEEREKTFEKEMSAILTPDQFQKWQSARAKAIDRMKERGGQKPEKTEKQ